MKELPKLPTLEEIMDLAKLTPTDLHQSMIDHVACSGWYSFLLAKARVRTMKAKFSLEVLAANLDSEIRKVAEKAGKKITETVVHNTVVSLEEYQRAWEEYVLAVEEEKVLSAVVKMLDDKKDMMMSYAMSLRRESVEV
uniref:Uncharacterized protein n=1 Tax=candidate division CPR3 bacterium TaxID=2268181 RepID=A0A7V3J983_UNCC3